MVLAVSSMTWDFTSMLNKLRHLEHMHCLYVKALACRLYVWTAFIIIVTRLSTTAAARRCLVVEKLFNRSLALRLTDDEYNRTVLCVNVERATDVMRHVEIIFLQGLSQIQV